MDRPVLRTAAVLLGLLPATAFAAHPQTVWNAAKLSALQAGNPSDPTNIAIRNSLAAAVSAWDTGNVDPDVAAQRTRVAGYAMGAKILNQPGSISGAVSRLASHCAGGAYGDADTFDSAYLMNAAIGYDVLFNDMDAATRNSCASFIDSLANSFMGFTDPNTGEWWVQDPTNNHFWQNFSALGIAGQARDGENPNAASWRARADSGMLTVKSVQDLVPDGTWHEGIGYFTAAMRLLLYHVGQIRNNPGYTTDKSALMQGLGRYILAAQEPNFPYIFMMTNADWNWVRPGIVAMLRYSAWRFQDKTAAEAARRYDSNRINRWDFVLDNAGEYVFYDPTVQPPPNMNGIGLDQYFSDQQTMIMRDSWNYGPSASTLMVGMKAGVLGGRGLYNAMKPGVCGSHGFSQLNFGHDHIDDLSIWMYGKGGWQLPEQVAYKLHGFCGPGSLCDSSTNFDSTPWHNTFLFDDTVGELGDTKSTTGGGDSITCTGSPPWGFFSRDATVPLHTSTDHYGFVRADGTSLYPSSLGLQSLLRTLVLSRELAYVELQDQIVSTPGHKVAQLFHALRNASFDGTAGWVKLDNTTAANSSLDFTPANNTALGIKIVSPPGTVTTVMGGLTQDQYWRPIDDDGLFGYLQIRTPGTPTSVVFSEVLFPTTLAAWPSSLPAVAALDSANADLGYSVASAGVTESTIFNTRGVDPATATLRLQGSDQGSIGIARYSGSAVVRIALQGIGALFDSGGSRKLLDLGAGRRGALEIAFDGTGATATASGDLDPNGAVFYGPSVTAVQKSNGDGTFTALTMSGPDAAGLVVIGPFAPAPLISAVQSSVTSSSATVTWTTDQLSDSQVDYGPSVAYGTSTPVDTTMTTSHSVAINGLQPGTTYHYRVRSKNSSGVSGTSGDFVFTTQPGPVISAVAHTQTQTTANITWTTDQSCDSQVDYGTTAAYGSSTALDPTLAVSHSQSLSGLMAGTLYHFRVKSRNSSGVLTTSGDFTLTTTPANTQPISTLADAFNGTSIGTAWSVVTQNAGTASESAGSLNLAANPNSGTTQVIVNSASSYSLVGSAAQVRVDQVVSSAGSINNRFVLLADTQNFLGWLYESGNLWGFYLVGGVRTNVVTIPYSATRHLWWRLRESAGTVYWETSPDGSTWLKQGSASSASLFTLTSVAVQFYLETFGAGLPAPGQASYSNLNVLPVSALTDAFSGTALDTTKWMIVDNLDGTISESGGSLNLAPNANDGTTQLSVQSTATYSLIGSSAAVKVPSVVNMGCNVNNRLMVIKDNANGVEWWAECGNLRAKKIIGGVETTIVIFPYNATQHRYWRIRESAGTTYFETSADSSSWTVQGSIADSSLFDLSAVRVKFYAETYGTGSPSPGRGSYSFLNPVAISAPADRFAGTAVDSLLWTVTAQTGGTVTEGGGALKLSPNANTGTAQLAVTSNGRYGLNGSSLTVQVPSVVNMGCNVNNSLRIRANSTNELEFWAECGNLEAIKVVNGVETNIVNIPYSPTDHLWWRIRETAGTTYWETSPDNVTWTVRASAPSTGLIPLDDLSVMFYSETYGTGTSTPGTAKYANMNTD
jgi:hypothetical protein